jgi:hypothetical protein
MNQLGRTVRRLRRLELLELCSLAGKSATDALRLFKSGASRDEVMRELGGTVDPRTFAEQMFDAGQSPYEVQ